MVSMSVTFCWVITLPYLHSVMIKNISNTLQLQPTQISKYFRTKSFLNKFFLNNFKLQKWYLIVFFTQLLYVDHLKNINCIGLTSYISNNKRSNEFLYF